MNTSIAFIGGGNMASGLIEGMIGASFEASQILVSEPDQKTLGQLQIRAGVNTTSNNIDTLSSDVVILATKPQQLQSVCKNLAASGKIPSSSHAPLFISIAAGIHSSDINRWLGGDHAIIRCMPNTPSLLQTGAAALYANSTTSDSQKKLAETIMTSVGITVWVENEDDLDTVTALSGSGPAYFFLLMEAMQIAGEQLGLDENIARKLTIQTALGAAKMADESDNAVTTLRKQVTSKGGTTESAINHFEKSGFFQLVKEAMSEARNKSATLADELGKDLS